MCGIAGVLDPAAATPADRLRGVAVAMAAPLRHRGPDDDGAWVDAQAGVAFGHRRLAIVDLSAEGHQPMRSPSGRHTLVFNGEIYNHGELRVVLEKLGHRFSGRSDTEVLLAAVGQWGVAEALQRCNGMFAMAVWDAEDRTLVLARDRLGEKPLYYGWAGGQVVFGSELKALRAHPAFEARVDRDALALYLRYTYVPTPHSIYQCVWKLPPGTTLTIRGRHDGPLPSPVPFWRLDRTVEAGNVDRFAGTEEEAAAELERLLTEAVGLRMHADVPLGAFLSGGIDSSTVVALMQTQASRPVRTFTIAMPEAGLDESDEARAVARHLGTDHTEVGLSVEEAQALIPGLPCVYDEPFSDLSQLPTSLVCAVARRHVVVSLSGDGGDEVFGGYNRYLYGRLAWKRLQRLPRPARSALARALLAPTPVTWDRLVERLSPLLPTRMRVSGAGDKARKLAGLLGAGDEGALYLSLVSHWDDPETLLTQGREPPTLVTTRDRWPGLADVTEAMMYLDTAVSLPDDMLTKVDRASMAVGLEARVPLLDHRVVEFAWRLPPHLRVGRRQGKHLLRQVLFRHVPPALIERPKLGFDPPVGTWLRGPLREWAESLLDERVLASDGYLDPRPIRRCWSEHLQGTRNWDYRLWSILMFQAWRQS